MAQGRIDDRRRGDLPPEGNFATAARARTLVQMLCDEDDADAAFERRRAWRVQ